MVRVRDAKPEELAPKPRKPRALSPRQLAIKRREQTIEKVLNELGAGPASRAGPSKGISMTSSRPLAPPVLAGAVRGVAVARGAGVGRGVGLARGGVARVAGCSSAMPIVAGVASAISPVTAASDGAGEGGAGVGSTADASMVASGIGATLGGSTIVAAAAGVVAMVAGAGAAAVAAASSSPLVAAPCRSIHQAPPAATATSSSRPAAR